MGMSTVARLASILYFAISVVYLGISYILPLITSYPSGRNTRQRAKRAIQTVRRRKRTKRKRTMSRKEKNEKNEKKDEKLKSQK